MSPFLMALALAFGLEVQTADNVMRVTCTVQRANCPETISVVSFNGRIMVDVETPGYTRRYYSVALSRRGTAVYLSEKEKDFAVLYPGGFDVLKTHSK